MPNKKVLVNFANLGREDYRKAQLRLIKSFVDTGWNGDYLIRSTDSYVDEYAGVKIKLGSLPFNKAYGLSPNQAEMPYAFKCHILQEAIEDGYTKLIWCDSTIVNVRNLDPLFELAAEIGFVSFKNEGRDLKYWITDIAQEKLGITDAQLETMEQCMACVMIFDIENPTGRMIFDEWMERCRDGVSFQMETYGSKRPGYRGHRGDQPIISGIAALHGIKLRPYGELVYQPHDTTFEYGRDFFFVNKCVDCN
jgi:hypothetical protein